MKIRGKKIISGLLLTAMMGLVIACGAAQQGMLTDTAAVRSETDVVEGVIIDDEAIALASRATVTNTMEVALQTAYDLVNAHRANAGVAALTRSQALEDCARVRAQEIVGYFSHTRPSGAAWWTVNSDIQYGENLAKLYNSADSVVAAWMASPTHAQNILDAGFRTLGMAIYQSGNNWYWAQEFGY